MKCLIKKRSFGMAVAQLDRAEGECKIANLARAVELQVRALPAIQSGTVGE